MRELEAAVGAAIADLAASLRRQAKGDCKAWDAAVRQASMQLPETIVSAAKREAPCKAGQVATRPDKPVPGCEAQIDELVEKGRTAISGGQPERAIAPLERAAKCRFEVSTMKLLIVAICKAENVAKAKALYSTLVQPLRDDLVRACDNYNVKLP